MAQMQTLFYVYLCQVRNLFSRNSQMFSQFKFLWSSQPRSTLNNLTWRPSGIPFSQIFSILCCEVGQTNAYRRNFVRIIYAKKNLQSKIIFCSEDFSGCTWDTQVDYAQPPPRHSHRSCTNERPGTLTRMVARYQRRHRTSLFWMWHVLKTQRIQQNLFCQYGIFPQVRGDFKSITLDLSMDLCGWSGLMPTLNTVVRNNYRTQTDSTLCANFEKFSPCWVTLSKSSLTLKLHPHLANSANSAISMESVIYDQHRILQQMERLNALSKCSNVLFVRFPILPRRVHFLPQQAN